MSTLTPKEAAGTKVIAKACTWADRRKAAQTAPAGPEKKREAGRYERCMDELSEAVEKYRNAGGQP